MTGLRSVLIHTAAFALLPLLVGILGMREYATREHPAQLARASSALLARAPRPTFDPALPTVVVLLGADITEITDALGPYEMFARVGSYNVIAAAPERRPTLLTGGLTVLPHYSLPELDTMLAQRAADVVVVPNLPNIAEPINAPIVEWLRKQAAGGALMHSWCKGAMALAEAGLLDGQKATAHWGDLPSLERRYPQVEWVRGVRWLEHDQFVISAGITSGVDASLRVITRLNGEHVARRVAEEIRYPTFHFARSPAAEQYELRASDAVLLANAAFAHAFREQIGVALYPGVGELDLSNIYDAHAYTMVADVRAVSERSDFVVSAHGLTLIPSIVLSESPGDAAHLDRLMVPGTDAMGPSSGLAALASPLKAEYLHASAPRRFGLEPVLEDLARSSDKPTAQFALRRMEYRSGLVNLDGPVVPWRVILVPTGLGALGLLLLRLLAALRRRVRGRRTRVVRTSRVSVPNRTTSPSTSSASRTPCRWRARRRASAKPLWRIGARTSSEAPTRAPRPS